MPMSARRTPASAVASSGAKKSTNAGSATACAASEERERRKRLAEPDRAPVARREHETVEHAVLVLGNPGAREPEQRGEDDRHPEQAVRGVVPRPLREREVEDDEVERTNRSIAGSVSRARSSTRRSFRVSADDVGEVRHASASLAVASCPTRRRARVSRRRSCAPRELGELPVEERGALLVERSVRLVEHEQVGVVEQRSAQREPLRHASRVRVHALVARIPEPEALEQHPDPLPSLGDAVQPAEEVEVLEGAQLPVHERLVREEARGGPRSTPTSSEPRVGRASPASSRRSVVLPDPFGPVTTRNASRGRSRSTPGERAPRP